MPVSINQPDIDLVSVVIPAYNAARFLLETLKSVSAQTYENLEIVVVDDGSSDNTRQILLDYKSQDDRLVIVDKENGGISSALNLGLEKARGAFVARVDADDLMMPDRIETQLTFMKHNPELGFCASAINFIDENSRDIGEYVPKVLSLPLLKTAVKRREQFSFTHPTIMMRRDIALALGGYDKAFEPCEDQHLFLRFLQSGHPGIAMKEKLTRYRLHAGSISGRNTLRQVKMTNLVYENFYRIREGKPPIARENFERRGTVFHQYFCAWNWQAEAYRVQGRYHLASGDRHIGRFLLAVSLLMRSYRAPKLVRRMFA